MRPQTYYTIKGLAYLAKVDPLTIAFKISTKEIPATKIAHRLYIKKQHADHFIATVQKKRSKQARLLFA